jgi:hypothetical protein
MGAPSIEHVREKKVKKKVEFDAHKVVKQPTEVEFTTKSGKTVDFVAKEPTRVPVHVKFKANKD